MARILFRVDGSEKIGVGHLVRCIAMAQMLREHVIVFVCKEIPSKILSEITDEGFICQSIQQEQDFFLFLNRDDIVIVDGYQFDTGFQLATKRYCKKLINIDDLHDQEFFSDLIINHAPSVRSSDYHVQPYTEFALGTDYALLRQEFLSDRYDDLISDTHAAMICFGGADPKDLTTSVCSTLSEDGFFEILHVVVGASYDHGRLQHEIFRHPKVVLHQAINASSMLQLMKKCGLAVVPASGVLVECLAAGTTVVSGMYIENQKLLYEQFKSCNLFLDAGNFNAESLRFAIAEYKQSSGQQLHAIDRLSGRRINQLISRLLDEDRLIMRHATSADTDVTYGWACSDIIRRYSFNRQPIQHDEHAKWFESKISSRSCRYYIASFNGTDVGSIRFDIDDKTAVISYLIDPGHHQRGFGISILKNGMKQLIAEGAPVSELVGYVQPENLASVKIFEKLGYTKLLDGDNLKFTKNI